MRHLARCASVAALLWSSTAWSTPLVVDGSVTTNTCPGGTIADGGRACRYDGSQTFDSVSLKNGARLYVTPLGAGTGDLVLKSVATMTIDKTSRIVAKGSGYQARACNDGAGPPGRPLVGGRGGCSVRDGGGGGGHLGAGGRGTKDLVGAGPVQYEESCGTLDPNGLSCTTTPNCIDGNGLPTTAGQSYHHDAYTPVLGAAGGDKGCLDNDGFDVPRGGSGGGRIVLVAANAAQTGVLQLDGRVMADGQRGCAAGNDPAGGGAGGSVLLVADRVQISATARISAHGGRGGDTAPKCLPCNANADCESGQTCQAVTDPQSGASQKRCGPCDCVPCTSNAQCNTQLGQTCKSLGGNVGMVCADASNQCTPVDPGDDEIECKGTQNSGTCQSCGGGGGGGLLEVRARVSAIDPLAVIDARGGDGGRCPVCVGEAGAAAPAVHLDLAYVGEVCDGLDNDFDGAVDNGLPMLACAGGIQIPSCVGGLPQTCPMDAAACAVTTPRTLPRFTVVVGTAASMLLDRTGSPHFGDGSLDHPGVATGNPTRLEIVKDGLTGAFAAMQDKSIALARFYQDPGASRSCASVGNAECAGQGYSYDDPAGNVAPVYPSTYPGNQCVLTARYPLASYPTPSAYSSDVELGRGPGDADCINYAGSCGPPRRGAQVLVGFDQPLERYTSWLDGAETQFTERPSDLDGARCANGDCELRATGDHPLAGSLQAVADWVKPIRTCDANLACRSYATILVLDGVEDCDANPVTSATALLGLGVRTYVVVPATLDAATHTLANAIATAGGTNAAELVGGTDQAFFAATAQELQSQVQTIMNASVAPVETCNGLDDDCNGVIDEGFAVGTTCDNGKLGVCRVEGAFACDANGLGVSCSVQNADGAPPADETCNGLDDDCNGVVDDLDVCTPDAGTPIEDASAPTEDASAPTEDASAPTVDAGSAPARDAGTSAAPRDAGEAAPVPDDGTDSDPTGGSGCACTTTGSSRRSDGPLAFALASVALWLTRRRRARDPG